MNNDFRQTHWREHAGNLDSTLFVFCLFVLCCIDRISRCSFWLPLQLIGVSNVKDSRLKKFVFPTYKCKCGEVLCWPKTFSMLPASINEKQSARSHIAKEKNGFVFYFLQNKTSIFLSQKCEKTQGVKKLKKNNKPRVDKLRTSGFISAVQSKSESAEAEMKQTQFTVSKSKII